MNTPKPARSTMSLAALAAAAVMLSPAAMAQSKPVDTTPSKHQEVIHHPNYDKTVDDLLVLARGRIHGFALRHGRGAENYCGGAERGEPHGGAEWFRRVHGWLLL